MSWYDSAIAGWYRSKIASADAIEQGISTLGTSIGKAIEESRQNSVANQIGTQMGLGDSAAANSGAYAPRAGLVSAGTNPDTGDQNQIPSGVSTQGTNPQLGKFTGGYKGLQLATAIDSLRRQNANTASEIGLRKAQSDYYGAHAGYLGQEAAIRQQRADSYQQSVDQKNKTTAGLTNHTYNGSPVYSSQDAAPPGGYYLDADGVHVRQKPGGTPDQTQQSDQKFLEANPQNPAPSGQ